MAIIILILSFSFSAYFWIKELYWLITFRKRGLYVYWDKFHTEQHIFMVVAWLLFWGFTTAMVCVEWCMYIPLIYNMLVFPFIIKHLESERLENKK